MGLGLGLEAVVVLGLLHTAVVGLGLLQTAVVGLGLLHRAVEAVSPSVVGVRVRGQPWPRGTTDMITPAQGAAPNPSHQFGSIHLSLFKFSSYQFS